MTASGRPLTNSTTSGRRVCWPSATVNWLTASQSLFSGASKSSTRAWSPAIEPSGRRYSTVTPSTSIRWIARLRSIERRRVGPFQLAECVVQRFGWKIRIQSGEGLPQPAFQHHVAVVRVAAFGRRFAGRDRRTIEYRVTERLQPCEGGILDDGFVKKDVNILLPL